MERPELDEAPEAVVRDADLALPIISFPFIYRFRVPVFGISQLLVDIIFSTPVVVELVIPQIVERTKGRRARRRVDGDWRM